MGDRQALHFVALGWSDNEGEGLAHVGSGLAVLDSNS